MRAHTRDDSVQKRDRIRNDARSGENDARSGENVFYAHLERADYAKALAWWSSTSERGRKTTRANIARYVDPATGDTALHRLVRDATAATV